MPRLKPAHNIEMIEKVLPTERGKATMLLAFDEGRNRMAEKEGPPAEPTDLLKEEAPQWGQNACS